MIYINKLRYNESVPVFGKSAGTHYGKMYLGSTPVLGIESVQPIDYEAEYFTVTNLEVTSITVNIQTQTDPSSMPKIAYMKSTDSTWTEITRTEERQVIYIELGAGQSVKVKGQGTSWQDSPWPVEYANYANIDASGRFAVSGNLWSLLYWDSFYGATINYTQNDMWACLFQSRTTTTPNHCTDAYNLVIEPQGLTITAGGAFSRMFQDNPYITRSPLLSYASLVDYQYWEMFNNCTALEEVRCLATSGINENNSTGGDNDGWMAGAKANGTFYKAAGATWPRADYGIPTSWTAVDYVA